MTTIINADYNYDEVIQEPIRNKWFFDRLSSVCKDKIIMDVGAGCGLLSLMALHHGAKHVYMNDIHPEFEEIVSYNFIKNNIPKEKYTIIQGAFDRNVLENLTGPSPDVIVSDSISGDIFNFSYGPWHRFCHTIKESNINPIIIPEYVTGSIYLLPYRFLETKLEQRSKSLKTGVEEFDKKYTIDGNYRYETYRRMSIRNFQISHELSNYSLTNILNTAPCIENIITFDAYNPKDDLTWKQQSSLPNKKYTALLVGYQGKNDPRLCMGIGHPWPSWFFEFNKTSDTVVAHFSKEKNTFFIYSE